MTTSKAASKFFARPENVAIWNNFFDRYPNKDDIILDFGCGAAWSIYVGRKRGFNIYGLDIGYEKTHPLYKFNEFRRDIGVSKYVKLYDGFEKFPFDDNFFSIIVCRSSLMKYTTFTNGSEVSKKNLQYQRLEEFIRILNEKKTMIITPYGYRNEIANDLRSRGVKTIQWTQKHILKKFRREQKK